MLLSTKTSECPPFESFLFSVTSLLSPLSLVYRHSFLFSLSVSDRKTNQNPYNSNGLTLRNRPSILNYRTPLTSELRCTIFLGVLQPPPEGVSVFVLHHSFVSDRRLSTLTKFGVKVDTEEVLRDRVYRAVIRL